MSEDFHLVAVNGSPSSASKTHTIAARAVEIADGGRVIDLGDLDPSGLLGRAPSPDVTDALAAIAAAPALLFATPTYRATYSGLLKVLLDQLPSGAFAGKACIVTATGGSPHHSLMIDHGLRPLVSSLEGWTVPTALYATSVDFDEQGDLVEASTQQLARAVAEARAIVTGNHP